MSSQLFFFIIYNIHPSAHKQLRRHLPTLFMNSLVDKQIIIKIELPMCVLVFTWSGWPVLGAHANNWNWRFKPKKIRTRANTGLGFGGGARFFLHLCIYKLLKMAKYDKRKNNNLFTKNNNNTISKSF